MIPPGLARILTIWLWTLYLLFIAALVVGILAGLNGR